MRSQGCRKRLPALSASLADTDLPTVGPVTDTDMTPEALYLAYENAMRALQEARVQYVAVADSTTTKPFPELPPSALVPDGLPVLARLHDAVIAAERAWLRSLG